MKNRDVLKLWNGLIRLGNRKNTKFNFTVLRNKKIIKEIVESLQAIQLQPIDGYEEFNKEREKLREKYAARDENNNPIQIEVNGKLTYKLTDPDKFTKDCIELLNSHTKYKDNLDIRITEMEEILNQDVDINLVKISIDDLPDDLTEIEISLIEEIICEKYT